MTTYLSDDFSEANGTVLDGKSLDVGGVWTGGSAGSTVENGQASVDRANTIYADAGDADVQITANWTPIVSADHRDNLVLRGSSNSTGWQVNYREPNNDIRLLESGSTVRSSASQTINAGQTYALKATADGQTVKGYFDGVEKVSYALATLYLTVTTHGIAAANNVANGGRIDDFIVSSIGGSVAVVLPPPLFQMQMVGSA